MCKYQVTKKTFVWRDGWETYASSEPMEKFNFRKEAEAQYGRFFDRLPVGKPEQILEVFALWKFEKDGETADEVVGYIKKK